MKTKNSNQKIKKITKSIKQIIKFTKKYVNLILYLLGKRILIDNTLVRKVIRDYAWDKYENSKLLEYIHEVKVYQTREKYDVYLTTFKPGIIIGKGGNEIDSIKNKIKYELNMYNLEIHIVENKLWNFSKN